MHQLESLALPFESYQLAYTPELVTDIFGTKVNAALLTEGKFTNSEGDTNWWIRSGTTEFKTAGENQTDAQNRFYAPVSYTDPYGATTKLKYYGTYFLFIEETEDALGNRSGVVSFNFRTLSPKRMKDINGNFSEAISDELGLVKAIAVMGKGNEADELTGLSETTDAAEVALISNFILASDSVQLTAIGKNLLKRASSRFVYDFDAYTTSGKPAVVAAITREQHFHKLADSPVQIAFEYSNGIGDVLMKKVQAESGNAKQVIVNPDNTIAVNEINTANLVPKQLRWIGNGRTIKNNKGNAVKQYEPYFSLSWHYEDYKELVETGVTPILYYDAAGRLIKTEMPDGTFSKVEFDSWKQRVYDANDTVLESDWYLKRTDASRADFITGSKEQQAAAKAAKHANTPNWLHFDTLGRAVLSIDHNKNMATDVKEFYRTKIKLDAEGNLRKVNDARELVENAMKGNTVMQYKYDMLGNLVYQKSMDAGQRWLLTNISGKPLRTWDERNHEFQYFYDVAQRLSHSKVLGGDGDAPLDHIFGRVVYGESLLTGIRTDANRFNEAILQADNILGMVIKTYDTGGLVDTPKYDFKGQALATTRKLFRKYKEVANWADANLLNDLEPEAGFTFTTLTDALGRITQQTAPDGCIITPSYNEAGLLDGETVLHPGAVNSSVYIKNIDYNEKGQRNKIIYGNNVSTKFYYDKETFRLKRVESKRKNGDPLQDWHYTYDPVGNITHIEDKVAPVQFFRNSAVPSLCTYTYDAIYRLAEATGRENNITLNFGSCDNWNDKPFMQAMNSGDPMAVRNYTQSYRYDAVGNIMEMKHQAPGGNWTRGYEYEKPNNRLIASNIGGNGSPANYIKYKHHASHGFMEELPHLEKIGWNFKEEVVLTTRQHCTEDGITPVITYYQYDGGGQRIRKITENQAVAGGVPTKKEERIYISGYELYKKHTGTDAGLERTTLSLMDSDHRFLMVESRNELDYGTEKQLIRYQLHNHLGSSALELDGSARVISYEEYHPYGTTAYQAKNATIKSAAKHYRYTGMERDEESGLEYHLARYYLPWLGRWLSRDPIGLTGGIHLYSYTSNGPLALTDRDGTQEEENEPKQEIGVLSFVDIVLTCGPKSKQTPLEFVMGMGTKLKSITYDPLYDLYGPEGMLERAATKIVVEYIVDEGGKVEVTPEEHARWGRSIFQVLSMLFPGSGKTVVFETSTPFIAGNGTVAMATTQVVIPNAVTQIPVILMSTFGVGGGQNTTTTEDQGSTRKEEKGKKPESKEPGEWNTDFNQGTGMTKEQAKYQQQISGKPPDQGYYVKGRQFDAFKDGKLVDAKYLQDEGRFAKAYDNMNKGKFGDIEYLIDKGEGLLKQAQDQVKVAGNTPIEWHVSGEVAATAIQRMFKAYKIPIKIRHVK